MDVRSFFPFYKTSSPIRAAAQKEFICNLFVIEDSRNVVYMETVGNDLQALLEELSTRLKRRSELEGQLFDAFQENDIDAVRSYLEELGSTDAARVINSTPSGISTLLYRASHTGKSKTIFLSAKLRCFYPCRKMTGVCMWQRNRS